MIVKQNTAFFRILIVCIGVILVFSCSGEDDMRQGVLEALGEPDEIEKGGSGAYKYERYIYRNSDIDRVYIFQKSAPGCGSGGNWYVEYVYQASYYGYEIYETPRITDHIQVETAIAGQPIPISAVVTDDDHVVGVDLFYKTAGAADSIEVYMTVSDSLYSAEIPAEAVKAPGVEYFIRAFDGDHYSTYPPKGYVMVMVAEEGVVTEEGAGKITKAPYMIDPKKRLPEKPVPGDGFNGSSPLSP